MPVNFDPEDLESRERYSYRSVVPGADTAQAVVNPDGSLVGSAPPAGGATAANQALEIAALNEIATDTDHLDANLSTLATQATLAEIATDTDNLATITTNTTGLATQATLAEIALDTDHLDANLSTLATSAAQATGNASLSSLDGKTVHVDTGNVTVSSSALPTGAATSANQATEIADLNSIVTNTTGLATQATLAEIATDTDNLATIVTNTTGLATQATLAEIATDTDNLATILANQTNGTQKALNIAALVPVAYDTIQVTVVDGSDRPTTILYKTGGLGGAPVATLTIVYDGSGNFQSVVRT
jgi:hypothetical protein